MSAQTGKGKLMQARAAALQSGMGAGGSAMVAQPGAGPQVSAGTDSALLSKSHDRTYNPVSDAQRASVSTQLNGDAARYRKGPGPA